MEIHLIQYVIREKDLPVLADIKKMKDRREEYFIEDYAAEVSRRQQSARDCHREYKGRDYWIQMFEQTMPGISVVEYSKINWSHDSAIVIATEDVLNEAAQKEVIDTFTELYHELSEIKTLTFDLRLNPSYKKAVEMDGIDVFEDWLYGNVFCQTPEHCDTTATHMKVKDGIYNMTFTKDVDEYMVRKYVDEFIEEEMVGWLEQDVPKKKAKGA